MNIIGVIPARFASSRFEGKPLAEICGKPMIWWVYKQVEKVGAFKEIYVATEDKRIAKVCNEYGMNVMMTSTAHQTGTDRIAEVALKAYADYYVNIQGDEPLIEPQTIIKLIKCLSADKSIDVLNTMTPISDMNDINSESCVKVACNRNGSIVYLSRSQIPFSKKHDKIQVYKHLGLYGLSREALLFFTNQSRGYLESIEDIEMLRFIENGINIKALLVDTETYSVDNPEDIIKVEIEMKKRDKNEKS